MVKNHLRRPVVSSGRWGEVTPLDSHEFWQVGFGFGFLVVPLMTSDLMPGALKKKSIPKNLGFISCFCGGNTSATPWTLNEFPKRK